MDKKLRLNIEHLEAVLAQALERQRQMLSLLERKRLALRGGKDQEMIDLTRLENATVQSISEIEKRRLQLVADLTLAVDPQAKEPLKMKDLAERLPEQYRGRLLVMRGKLVEAITQVAEQTSVVRRASESLMKHVNGLIRTIGVVSHGGAAYGQTGRVNAKPARMSTLNLTA
ncbi:MAG: flagellar export chaperone FlgN [Planctomycetota bacterium]